MPWLSVRTDGRRWKSSAARKTQVLTQKILRSQLDCVTMHRSGHERSSSRSNQSVNQTRKRFRIMEHRVGRDRRRLYPKGLDASMLADSDDKHVPDLRHSRAKNMTVLVAGDAAAMKRRCQHCPNMRANITMISNCARYKCGLADR
jgi:hypothetical protein